MENSSHAFLALMLSSAYNLTSILALASWLLPTVPIFLSLPKPVIVKPLYSSITGAVAKQVSEGKRSSSARPQGDADRSINLPSTTRVTCLFSDCPNNWCIRQVHRGCFNRPMNWRGPMNCAPTLSRFMWSKCGRALQSYMCSPRTEIADASDSGTGDW